MPDDDKWPLLLILLDVNAFQVTSFHHYSDSDNTHSKSERMRRFTDCRHGSLHLSPDYKHRQTDRQTDRHPPELVHTTFTISLTPWSRVLPEKLKRPQLLRKFPACYGTPRFITAFTRSRHLSLSSARLIQSMPPHPTSRRSILILSSHLRLSLASGLLPSSFPTKALYYYRPSGNR